MHLTVPACNPNDKVSLLLLHSTAFAKKVFTTKHKDEGHVLMHAHVCASLSQTAQLLRLKLTSVFLKFLKSALYILSLFALSK